MAIPGKLHVILRTKGEDLPQLEGSQGRGYLVHRGVEALGTMLQANVWTMKDVISSQTDTGLSRGLPAPKAVHAGV